MSVCTCETELCKLQILTNEMCAKNDAISFSLLCEQKGVGGRSSKGDKTQRALHCKTGRLRKDENPRSPRRRMVRCGPTRVVRLFGTARKKYTFFAPSFARRGARGNARSDQRRTKLRLTPATTLSSFLPPPALFSSALAIGQNLRSFFLALSSSSAAPSPLHSPKRRRARREKAL